MYLITTGEVRDVGSTLGWEDPPGRVNDTPLQYSFWENFMDRGAWQAMRSQSVGHN